MASGEMCTPLPQDAELVAFVWHFAHLGVDKRAEEAPVRELRVADEVAGALYHAGRHAGMLQEVHQRARVVRGGEGGELAVDPFALRDPSGGAVQLRRHRPGGLAERGAQRAPVGIGLDGDRAPLVGTRAWIDVVRRRAGRQRVMRILVDRVVVSATRLEIQGVLPTDVTPRPPSLSDDVENCAQCADTRPSSHPMRYIVRVPVDLMTRSRPDADVRYSGK
jgi:hypothetical protein